MVNEEITRRVRGKLKNRYVYLKGASIEEIKASHAKAVAEVTALLPTDAELETIIEETTTEFQKLAGSGMALSRFRRKKIIRQLYANHFSSGDYSYSQFCIAVATYIGATDTATKQLDPMFDGFIA